MTKKTVGIVVGLVIVALAAAAWWWQRGRSPAVEYRTARIERGSLQATVSASGMVTPVSQIQISSQISGQIKELMADFNSEVKRGQLIARIDPETYDYRLRQAVADVEASRASVLTAQANVQSALAQVSRAQVELAEAQRDVERKQNLVAQNFISPAEADTARSKAATLVEALKVTQAQVDVARAQARNAEAVVRQREAQQQQARVDLERTQIRSPVDGIVIKRSIEVGQTVAASLQAPELFVIARNLSDMQVEAAIDEADISRVRGNQKVSFTIDAFPGRTFDGSVRQVRKAALSASNVVTYTVVVGFANPGSTLLPGMTANVRIVTETRDDVLKLANAALRVRIAGVEPPLVPARSATASIPLASSDGTAPSAAAASALPVATDRPGRGQGGPLAEFRNRLVTELELTPSQITQVDALLAANRSRFAELRTVPEDQRGKARDRIMADLRAAIGEQLSAEQRPRYQNLLAEAGGRQTTRGRIYLLGEDGEPRAVNVRLGITDGTSTELIVPSASSAADNGGVMLKEGATVITGVVNGASPNASGQRGPGAPRPSPF